MPEEYKLLDKSVNYDVDKVRELVKAANELIVLNNRGEFLRKLVQDNQELSRYIHKTRDGSLLAIADMEDSHIENLMRLLIDTGAEISAEIQGEAKKRKLQIPLSTRQLSAGNTEEIDDL